MFLKKVRIATTHSAIALATLFSLVNPILAQNPDQIYVFGDSLSDTGNVFKATRQNSPSSPSYYQGRYANGRVWVEYLASRFGLTLNQENNFAYGGAKTGASQNLPLGLLTQINRFRSSNPDANPNGMYLVWAGANDYLGGATDTTITLNNLERAIRELSQAGATNIVVLNLPDLGKLPGTRQSQRAAALSAITSNHNSQLAELVNNLRQQLSPGTNLTHVDVNSIFNQAIENPNEFGLTNVTDACLSRAGICNNPDEYLFWDGIHPTTAAHQLLVELGFPNLQSASEITPADIPSLPVILGATALGGVAVVAIGKQVSNSQ